MLRYLSTYRLVIALCLSAPLSVCGQPGENQHLPAFGVSFVSSYNIDAGLPISCMFSSMTDNVGRFWINPCFGQTEDQTVDFFQFDGQHTKKVALPNIPPGINAQAALAGCMANGTLVGSFRETSCCFFYHPDSGNVIYQRIDSTEAVIEFIGVHKKSGTILYATTTYAHLVYRIQENAKPLLLASLPRLSPRYFKERWWHPQAFLLTENDFWFIDAADTSGNPIGFIDDLGPASLYQYHLANGQLNRHILREVFGPAKQQQRIAVGRCLAEAESGNILVYLNTWDKFWEFNPNTREARDLAIFPRPTSSLDKLYLRSSMQQDEQGNTVFCLPVNQFLYKAVLMDVAGRFYDYSAAINDAIAGAGFKKNDILQISSADFTRHVNIYCQGGLIAADLHRTGMVTTGLQPFPTRAIAALGENRYLVVRESTEPVLIELDANDEVQHLQTFRVACDSLQHDRINIFANIREDGQGGLWFPMKENLIHVNADNSQCSVFPLGLAMHKFVLADAQTVLYADIENFSLHAYDLVKRTPKNVRPDGKPLKLPATVNQMERMSDGSIWIATLHGLWHYFPENGLLRREDTHGGFQDERFMCMETDETGRLWLGTFSGGLNIYDPRSGKVEVLDKERGLSNNTVVGIVTDQAGVRWISTYGGVNLVSPEGTILTQLFQEDGFSASEFNRFSYYTDRKGRVFLGTISGFNIIDPTVVKKQVLKTAPLRLYLSSVYRYQAEIARDTDQVFDLNQQPVFHLPAEHRYIVLHFALNSLVRSSENRFAYQLIHLGKESSDKWTYLGNRPEINLPDLAPGRYEIWIKAWNYRGNSALEMIKVQLIVSDFFYRQNCFFVLVALFCAAMVWLWTRREKAKRVQLEQIVAQRTEKIQQDKQLIEKQAADLLKLDELKSRFFTDISHEFRTPLTIISGMTDQLEKNPERWLAKGTKMIRRSTDGLLQLINQILELRKLESGMLEVTPRRGDLVAFLRTIFEMFEALGTSRQLNLRFLSSQEELIVDFDQSKLLRILQNLLGNALKFTPNGGYIELSLDADKTAGEIQIGVSDTGSGIAQEELQRIFDRFYQSESGAMPGSGIGLALTRELVQLLGGRISVQSDVGAGTRFLVVLPLLAVAEKAQDQDIMHLQREILGSDVPAGHPAMKEPATQKRDLPYVLVVEDHADIALYLQICLENHYRVELAQNGQEGIDMAIETVPDLVISDVMMPEKDGFELCETLKNDERTSHIPIVLLTARSDVESRIIGLKRGADDYLAKPFHETELLVRLHNLLEQRARLQERYRHFADAGMSETDDAIAIEDSFIRRLREAFEPSMGMPGDETEKLCRAMNLSRSQLARKTKALTGRSLAIYLRSLRLQKARAILRESDLSVKEVAYDVGFSSPFYFSNAYREEFGESPSQTAKG